MNKELIYGDIDNIHIFDLENPNQRLNKKNKIFCNESYKHELLAEYNLYEEENVSIENFNIQIGQSVQGDIVSITQNDIVLHIGGKSQVYISLEKEKLNIEDFRIGQELEVLIISTKNNLLKGSLLEYTKNKLYQEMRSTDEKNIYDAKVLELSDNGYILDIQGVTVFMPGSLGGINKLIDFQELVGQTIKVVPVKNDNKYSKFKDQLIVSHRDYLKTLIPEEVEKLEIGSVYTGVVTDTTKFGVFLQFNNVLTGLIHRDDFDDKLLELFETNQIKPGTEIDFYLKEVVSNSRIILSRLVQQEQDTNTNQIKKGDIIQGKVTRIVKYGAFVSLANKKSGLIHSNKLKNVTELEKGDSINVKVLDIQGNKYDLDLA